MKKIFVMDFDGTIIADECIIAETVDSALAQMRPLNIYALQKVMEYLTKRSHYFILGSIKCLWNKKYQEKQERRGKINTCLEKYGTTTFYQYQRYMLAFLDEKFGKDRPYLLADDLIAYENFTGWSNELTLLDKNQLLQCVKTHVIQKFNTKIADQQIILVDDNEEYRTKFNSNYGFIHAQPLKNNSYLLKMLAQDIKN